MKKILLMASLITVISVSAQEAPSKEKATKEHCQKKHLTVDEKLKHFDSYNLTSVQKKKIKSLLEEQEANFSKNRANNEVKGGRIDKSLMFKDFDAKLEQILTKEQFNQYKEDRQKKSMRHKHHGHR